MTEFITLTKRKIASNDISYLEYNIWVDVARMHLNNLVFPWDILSFPAGKWYYSANIFIADN